MIVAGGVIGTMKTKKCEPFLIAGSLLGAVVLFGFDFLREWSIILENVVSNEAYLILVCILFGSIIALLTASRGNLGFAKLVSKMCNSERKTLLTTSVLGILVFVDDYLNVLSIGTAMKGVFDKRKIPGEALAFLLGCIGVAICTICPFSSWATYFGAIFFSEECVKGLGYESAFQTYLHVIGYCIYPIIILLIVLLFAAGIVPKVGTMKKAFQRIKLEEAAKDAEPKEEASADGNIWHFLIPLLSLIVVASISGNLIFGQVYCLITMLVMYLATKLMNFDEYWKLMIKGFSDMLPVITMLISAMTFQKILKLMSMTDYIIELTRSFSNARIFPMIAFMITAALSFMIASAWGVCSICAPILLQLGASNGANLLLVMAAIASGCALGNHVCFYCDTAILTAKVSDINNFTLAKAQLPYVLTGAVISAIGFAALGFVL